MPSIDTSDTIISFAGVTGVIRGPSNDVIIMDNVGDGVQGGSASGRIVPANAGVALQAGLPCATSVQPAPYHIATVPHVGNEGSAG